MILKILNIVLTIYLIVLGLIALNFLIFLLLYGVKKSWSVTRWLLQTIGVITPAQILCVLSILGYWFDRVKALRWITWVAMDDSRFNKNNESGYANDYWVFIQDAGKTKETYWIFLKWHIGRNRTHNIADLFKVPNSDRYNADGKKIGNNFIAEVEFISDNLYKNGVSFNQAVVQDGNWVTMAGLKYIPKREGDDIWQVNKGDIISRKTSILGDGGIWYGVGNWLGWRWSYCKEVKFMFFWKRWRTIKIGYNSSRPVITMKHQRIKTWE